MRTSDESITMDDFDLANPMNLVWYDAAVLWLRDHDDQRLAALVAAVEDAQERMAARISDEARAEERVMEIAKELTAGAELTGFVPEKLRYSSHPKVGEACTWAWSCSRVAKWRLPGVEGHGCTQHAKKKIGSVASERAKKEGLRPHYRLAERVSSSVALK